MVQRDDEAQEELSSKINSHDRWLLTFLGLILASALTWLSTNYITTLRLDATLALEKARANETAIKVQESEYAQIKSDLKELKDGQKELLREIAKK